MPARKHREGAEAQEWLARKERFTFQMAVARESVKQLTGHTLLRLDEAAAMLGVTKKTLRELEKQELPNSHRIFGNRKRCNPELDQEHDQE